MDNKQQRRSTSSSSSSSSSVVQWDRWSTIESALKKKSSDSKDNSTDPVITLVCIANDWHPSSLASAKTADSLRRDPSFPKHSQLFVLNGDDTDDRTVVHYAYGFTSTPSFFFFYFVYFVTLRRPNCQDDNKFSCSLSGTNILDLLHSVKTAVDADKKAQFVRMDV